VPNHFLVSAQNTTCNNQGPNDIYSFSAVALNGTTIPINVFKGKVVYITNVATF